MKKLMIICLSLVVVLFMLVECKAEKKGVTSLQEKTLKVGFLGILSGPAASWGVTMKNTYDLQLDEINGAGGIVVDGTRYKIELITQDSKYSGAVGRAAVEKLLHYHKVDLMIEFGASVVKLAIDPVTEPAHMLLMSLAAARENWTPDKPYSFHALSSIPCQGAVELFEWFKKEYPEAKRFATIHPNDELGETYSDVYKIAADIVGYQDVVSTEFFERKAVDYYPILMKVLVKKPDIITVSGGTGNVAMVVKQARELGYKGIMMSSTSHDVNKIVEIAGVVAAEGFMHPAFIAEGPLASAKLVEWKKKYSDRYGQYNEFSGQAISTIPTLVAGIKWADSIDSSKIKDAFEDPEFYVAYPFGGKAVWGGKELYGQNHNLMHPIHWSQIKNGKSVGRTIFLEPSCVPWKK